MITVVRYFNGEERTDAGRARTRNGTERLIRRGPMGDGWGMRIHGSASALTTVGAYLSVSGWVLQVEFRRANATVHFDCVVS